MNKLKSEGSETHCFVEGVATVSGQIGKQLESHLVRFDGGSHLQYRPDRCAEVWLVLRGDHVRDDKMIDVLNKVMGLDVVVKTHYKVNEAIPDSIYVRPVRFNQRRGRAGTSH